MTLSEGQFGYRMNHRPPDAKSGAPLHDVENVMPDFYQHSEYYSTGDDVSDRQSIRAISRVHGQPEGLVDIYRAAPEGRGTVSPGDWVTPSRSYAQQVAMHPSDPSKDMPVFSAKVPAKFLHTSGDSVNEFGYNGPQPIEGEKL